MIIKPKKFHLSIILVTVFLLSWFFRRRFNKVVIKDAEIKRGHSYLLMCNHFSFWDGIFAMYLSLKVVHKKRKLKGIHFMVLKKQMQMNPWLPYFGCFSISPGTTTVNESLNYAAEILSEPDTLLVIFPQGNLESQHVREIVMKDGVNHIVPQIKGDCQLLWSSNLIEYFESLKPSVYFNMLDCGSNHDFDFEKLSSHINSHHREAINKQFRFTDESGLN